MKFINGTKLDDRIIRTDLDPGFREGRQFGRGKSGGQVKRSLDCRCETIIGTNLTLIEVAGDSLRRKTKENHSPNNPNKYNSYLFPVLTLTVADHLEFLFLFYYELSPIFLYFSLSSVP